MAQCCGALLRKRIASGVNRPSLLDGVHRHLSRTVTFFILIAFTSGCGSPSSPSNSKFVCPAGYVSSGSMSATVDGTPWTAGCVAPVTYTAAAGLYLSGLDQPLDSGRALVIALVLSLPLQPPPPLQRQPIVPGTYQLGGPYSTYGGDPYALMDFFCTPGQTVSQALACSTWSVGPDRGSGTITITEITARTARGTFSLTMVPPSGITGPARTVTNGVFDVTF
jgi:hypothetical protein